MKKNLLSESISLLKESLTQAEGRAMAISFSESNRATKQITQLNLTTMNPNNYSNRAASLFSRWMACSAIIVSTLFTISASAQCTTPATVSVTDTAHVCAGGAYLLSGTIGGAATSATWSTNGTGTFDSTAVSTTGVTYVPSAADIAAGSVMLTLTTDDPDGASGPCLAESDSTLLYIDALPVVSISGSIFFCPGGFTRLPPARLRAMYGATERRHLQLP